MKKALLIITFLFATINAHAQSLYCGRVEWKSSNGITGEFLSVGFTLHALKSTIHVKTRAKGKYILASGEFVDHNTGYSYSVSFINHVSLSTPEYDYWESTSTVPMQTIRSAAWNIRRINAETTVDVSNLYVNNSDYAFSIEGVPENNTLPFSEKINGRDDLSRYQSTAEIEDFIDASDIIAGESRELTIGMFSGRIDVTGSEFPNRQNNIPTNNQGVKIDFTTWLETSTNNTLIFGNTGSMPGVLSPTPAMTPLNIKIKTTNDAIGAFTKTFDVTVNCD